MNQQHLRKLAFGAAVAGSLAAVPAAQANPFSLTTLASACMAAAGGTAPARPEAEKKEGETRPDQS